MSRRYDHVTFDCYGTLVDWEEGIHRAFSAFAAAHGYRIERVALLRAYAEIEPIVEAGPYRTYRDVLRETARRVARRFGRPMGEDEARFLADSLGEWPFFPDTVEALHRIAAAGHRLGILSNVDDDLLATTLSRLPASFELIVTAQEVASYKPGRAHFRQAKERIGSARWLHAAQSLYHDVAPALALGIPVAWINRKADPPGELTPQREFPSLAALADWLAR